MPDWSQMIPTEKYQQKTKDTKSQRGILNTFSGVFTPSILTILC